MNRLRVDVYPVGIMQDLQILRGALRIRQPRHAVRRLRYRCRALLRLAAEGKWRALKNNFNGYLAEPASFPDGLTRCGSGWTKARAVRSLHRHAQRDGVDLGPVMYR